MVANSAKLDSVFGALSDSTRRAILTRLAEGPATVGELAAPFEISLPAVSKHLKVLERAGLIQRRVDGRIHHCRLEAKPMNQALEWMDRYRAFWEQRFEALERYLEDRQHRSGRKSARKKRKEKS